MKHSLSTNNISINRIPYARSYQNIFQNDKNLYNLYNSKNTLIGLPPILKTPYRDEKYRQAYNNCSLAKDLIQTRLNKLMYEKKILSEMKKHYYPYFADYESIYKLRTLGNAKGRLGNPYLYNNQFMEPIYYPLEMPVCGEPVSLPKIEIGHPMNKHKCCNCGTGIKDLLPLFSQLNAPPRPPFISEPYPRRNPTKKSKKKIIPDTRKREPPKNGKRDWWKLCRDWCNIYTFFSTGKKYSAFAKIRDNIISDKTKSMVQDIAALKEWLMSITKSFWDEFKVDKDLDVSFDNNNSKTKIMKISEKIIAMIKKYLDSLISNSSKLQDVPENVQQIIYSYIKDKGFFAKSYLSTFQICRIDYNFYGGTKNLQADQIGMIIAFLIISGVTVQQILLHMKDNFAEFNDYPNIDTTAKYVGSIMHYLTRDTFSSTPIMLKEVLALLNYYRNYHIYNKSVESQDDIFNNNVVFKDEDEFADYLLQESSITEFWNLNPEFVETFKNSVFSWACRLGKLIRLKYRKTDENIFPERNVERPNDKTISFEEEE